MADVFNLLQEAIENNEVPLKVFKDNGYDLIKSTSMGLDGFVEAHYESYSKEGLFLGSSTERVMYYVNFMKNWNKTCRFLKKYDIETSYSSGFCNHDYVDCGFMRSKFVCKKCDKEKVD